MNDLWGAEKTVSFACCNNSLARLFPSLWCTPYATLAHYLFKENIGKKASLTTKPLVTYCSICINHKVRYCKKWPL